MTRTSLDDSQIKEAAYLYWLDEGQPEGRDQEHWLRAVDALSQASVKPKPARKAAAKPRTAKAAPKRATKAKAKAK